MLQESISEFAQRYRGSTSVTVIITMITCRLLSEYKCRPTALLLHKPVHSFLRDESHATGLSPSVTSTATSLAANLPTDRCNNTATCQPI